MAERGELLMQRQAARQELQSARIAVRRDDPELQALADEIKKTQDQMIARLSASPRRAELAEALKSALGQMAEIRTAAGGDMTEGGIGLAVADPASEEERAEAEAAVVRARQALNQHLHDVRTCDPEYLELSKRAQALRARFEAEVAERPAVIEAQARYDQLEARAAELVKEQKRIFEPETESPSEGTNAN
ncbi:MAG: hypothetical protein KBA51_02775 [Kiritimatiellae bacterium]|nr:hypothetical protein [Kiritimatiellia bacterium]